ncbi:serine/threonine-protein kinase HSL1,negative regulator of Swe1 kinase [Trypanosoma cruzi]|nr:serine/threonine-protein kinase HSL1,negative regulator of Swe1 kinase [Trypanosoma cruzi]
MKSSFCTASKSNELFVRPTSSAENVRFSVFLLLRVTLPAVFISLIPGEKVSVATEVVGESEDSPVGASVVFAEFDGNSVFDDDFSSSSATAPQGKNPWTFTKESL